MKMHRSVLLLMGFVLAAFAFGAAAEKPAAKTAPAHAVNAKAGDCAVCHKDKGPLPAGHVATGNLTFKDCEGCHQKNLNGKLPGSHLHALNGVSCVQCHGNASPKKAVDAYRCEQCHDTKQLAQKTAGVTPHNPHDNRHYGTEGDCNMCHHQHKKSENNCAQCHKFNFLVP